MLQANSESLASGAVGLVLVATLTFPSTCAVTSHFRATKSRSKSKVGVYRDKDGAATEESMRAFTAKTPKIFLLVFTFLGFATAVALAVLGTIDHDLVGMFLENWLNVAQWSLLLVQDASILLIRDSVKVYNLGIYATISSAFLLAALLTQDGLILVTESNGVAFTSSESLALRISQVVLVIFAGFSSISLPRRPEVFHGGLIVDGMYTASAIGRYTFAWIGGLLALARKKNRLELEDLPKMNHYSRSKDLINKWEKRDHPGRLWVEIFLEHKSSFLVQWALTLVQAFGSFAPQFVNYHLLKILEDRVPGTHVSPQAWIWVLALTIATIGSSWIESWLFWVCWSDLAIPIRAQLSALIFQKSMRRKDVKGASKTNKIVPGRGPDMAPLGNTTAGDKLEIEELDEGDPKGKQSTVNLIGVDSKRISEFCSFNNYFPGSVFKLTISFTFLVNIIGWKALLAGVLAMSVTIPINIYFSQRYAGAQDRLMKVRDAKMGVVTEALQGIRQIKFSALETNWHEKIGRVRKKELHEQWSVYISETFLLFCWITSPIALAAASLSVYAYLNGELTPSVAFTSIGVFGALEVTLAVMPELTTDLIDALVSVRRIEKYLRSPEITKHTGDSPNISFEHASIAWPSDEKKEDGDLRYILRDVNISFPERELSIVSGMTGSGKSLLLASILGEVDVLSGKINVPRPPAAQERRDHLATKGTWIIPSSIAFVAQIPWIENASIKNNILFGLPCDDWRYEKVIEVCALRKDMAMLEDGENTEIGANGINLSGGQRWRVTFARALYSRAGILVLDDIFSAVDAHVGRYIFEKALTGELGVGRTRILVTHHVALCKPKAKYIVELGDGTVENAGLVDELESDGTLQQIISNEEDQDIMEDGVPTAVNSSDDSSDGEFVEPLKKVDSKKAARKFVEDETREQGSVKFAVYAAYMKSSGGWSFWILALGAFAGLQVVVTGRSWWLKLWTGHDQRSSSAHAVTYSLQVHTLTSPVNSSDHLEEPIPHSLSFYLGIYVALSVASSLVGTFRFYYIFTGSIRASRRLFDKLSFTILRTPLRWMDTVPLGRILNRFTADFNIVDAKLAQDFSYGVNNVFKLFGVIVAGIFVSPYMILLSVLILGICVQIAILFITGAREVKRLESNTKSPVFEQFSSALTGVGTIRAFDKTETYIANMYLKLDDYSTAFWHLWAFNRWMGWRMALVGGFFATFVASTVLLMKNIDASLAGFAMSFALDYGQIVIWTIRHYTNVELDMNAAERIFEYCNLPTEPLHGTDPPAAWPSEGRLEVQNLVVGYAPDLDPVLKGLSFSVKRNERIGVVGRTGAGKSSLTLALFRFLEARQGSIHIDGLDISKIKLYALRSRLAIIPQDPVLFSGSVRSNLDAFDEHTDSELRDALERVHLISPSDFSPSPAELAATTGTSTPMTSSTTSNKNKNLFANLSSPITEGGLNLSQGQRQLLCLARAIVSRPKIMVLDEATSAVDMATDALIQRSIREEFGDSTLIVIAHRLSTIADFDKILVLDDGRAVEFGTPRELMRVKTGAFKSMVAESGERAKLEQLILVEGDN